MSSTTLEPNPSRRGAHAGKALAGQLPGDGTSAGPGPSFHRVLNSEFIKFRTLLSTLILLACTVLVVVGFGALSAWGTGQFAEQALNDPEAAAAYAAQGGDIAVGVPTSGIAFAQLILGSLGVLLMSSEFTTGMARSTFAAVPKLLYFRAFLQTQRSQEQRQEQRRSTPFFSDATTCSPWPRPSARTWPAPPNGCAATMATAA